MKRAHLTLLALIVATGCAVDPYCLVCPDGSADNGMDGATPDAGDGGADAGPIDAAPPPPLDAAPADGCVPGTMEICNHADDDCDGMVDEGIDTSTDLANCGGCGMACAPAHAFGECTGGSCVVSSCDVGFFDRDGDPSNGCEDHCVATEPTETLCDRRDNDCDGMIDENFDLMTDPMNCGSCGRTCRFAHASATCDAGTCALGTCDPGYVDIDGVVLTGCEYACTATGDETCNLRDDDCDGTVDEGDPGSGASCGSSTGACTQGTMHCVGGALTCMGGTGPTPEVCNGIDDDCDGAVDQGNPGGGRVCGSSLGVCTPGREQCTGGSLVCVGASTPGTESCNALDDDCDGMVDEGNPGGGTSCGSSIGACVAGTLQCMGGGLVCSGEMGPTLEVCNGVDDDCNGVVDNGYDLVNDPRNCGACGNMCSYPNAVAVCSTGTCAMGPCLIGFVNRDGSTANGCEYACDYTGAEVCNGRDDDCNGVVDDGLTAPATFCNANGVCAGTSPVCGGSSGWVCNYPSTYEATETRCDGLDNDCNGVVDDPFPTVGLSCDNGALGACTRTGTYICNSTHDGVTCTAPAPPPPGTEACNGIDDDCDGVIDNGAPASWVSFDVGGSPRWIFEYEASHPDATGTNEGSMTHRACSEPSRLPWTSVSPAEADAACRTLGAQLCTETEWQQACETAASTACDWSYASSCRTYSGATCNGFDNDVDSSTAGIQNGVLPTGAMAACYADWGSGGSAFDMSGNVQEWTAPRSAGVNPMRGGSYNDVSGGTTCQFNFEVAGDTFRAPNVGFRCCRSTAP